MSIAVPPVVVQPFGDTAAGGFITLPIPETPPVDPARASFELGFPPITFQPVVGGGLPPDGRDFNGILYTVTAHCAYIQAGQPYVYNAAVPTQSVGYGAGALLGMSDGSGFWFNLTANNAVNPDTTNTGWVPSYSYGFSIITGLTGGTLTLSVAQHRRNTIVLGGTLTSNLQVVFPITLREWRVVNQCSGAFTVTAKTAAGTGVVVPSGSFSSPVSVYGDGTNLYPVVSPLVLPLSVSPTPNSIVQRDGSGYVYAVYLNQSSGTAENPTIGAVFVQNNTADGFLRKSSLASFASQISVGTFAGTVTNAQVPQAAVTQHAAAVLANAALTGTATAPTIAISTNNTQIATTAAVLASLPKIAAIRMTGAGATVVAMNASGVRTSAGNYTITVSGAGFTVLPIATATITAAGINADQIYANPTSTTSISVQIRFGGGVDRDFNLIVVGT